MKIPGLVPASAAAVLLLLMSGVTVRAGKEMMQNFIQPVYMTACFQDSGWGRQEVSLDEYKQGVLDIFKDKHRIEGAVQLGTKGSAGMTAIESMDFLAEERRKFVESHEAYYKRYCAE